MDINVVNKGSAPFHIGFITKQAEEVYRFLNLYQIIFYNKLYLIQNLFLKIKNYH